MRSRAIAALLVTITTLANADPRAPFKETLSRKDREQIEKAIQAALPPVDKAKSSTCRAMLDAYNKDPEHEVAKLAESGACLIDAGALGAGIQTLEKYLIVEGVQDTMNAAKHQRLHDPWLALCRTYEKAALFRPAAQRCEDFATRYPTDPDASVVMTRATCIRRQLGDVREATSDYGQLVQRFKVKTPADALCDTVRPIAMP